MPGITDERPASDAHDFVLVIDRSSKCKFFKLSITCVFVCDLEKVLRREHRQKLIGLVNCPKLEYRL